MTLILKTDSDAKKHEFLFRQRLKTAHLRIKVQIVLQLFRHEIIKIMRQQIFM